MTTGGSGPRVVILGVGRMGLPIAERIAAAGFAVAVVDPDPARRELARERALVVAEGADAAIAGADILVSVLPGPKETAEAMGRALAVLTPGSLCLDLSSNDPELADRLAADAAARAIDWVAAPMGGGPTAARMGELRFFVGGTDAAIGRVRPVLEALGGPDSLDHLGASPGQAHLAKLLANLLWFGQVVAVTEALLLGASLGIPPRTLRHTLARSAGGSVFLDQHLDALLDGDDLATFGIDRCVEELDALVRLAQGAGVPFELSALVARLHRDALERFGAIDGELLAARLLEERAGRSLVDPDR